MVIASHVIFGAYGFWLPNDPRGSWSTFVGSWELRRFGGKPNTVSTRQSVAHVPHDAVARLAAKKLLKYPPVKFTGRQALEIGRAFGEIAGRNGLQILACAIMPEHIHLVLARHRYAVEQAVTLLKGAAGRRLVETGLHPLQWARHEGQRVPTCWERGEWKVFLDDEYDVRRAIEYVEANPPKEGLKRQRWSFVMGRDG